MKKNELATKEDFIHIEERLDYEGSRLAWNREEYEELNILFPEEQKEMLYDLLKDNNALPTKEKLHFVFLGLLDTKFALSKNEGKAGLERLQLAALLQSGFPIKLDCVAGNMILSEGIKQELYEALKAGRKETIKERAETTKRLLNHTDSEIAGFAATGWLQSLEGMGLALSTTDAYCLIGEILKIFKLLPNESIWGFKTRKQKYDAVKGFIKAYQKNQIS